MSDPQRPPHSAEEFDARRGYLWNADFLLLMRARWELQNVRRVLDVGCGIGHWTAVLFPLLPANAAVVGVDREPAWVKLATEIAEKSARAARTRFQVGTVEALEFPDACFDMVTCQTLLVHVADPTAALRQMVRVLKPGGLLAVVEPNNLVQALVPGSTHADEDPAEIVAKVRFQLLCERGRKKLGDGDISVGERVPGMMSALGLKDVRVHLSDKTAALFPPYSGDEQRTLARLAFEGPMPERWIWSREDTLRYFAAGGGAAAEFPALWDKVVVREPARQREAYRRGELARTGGRLLYVTSGRR